MEGNIKAVKQMQFVEVLKNRKNQIVDNHSMFALTILEKKNKQFGNLHNEA